MWKDYHMVKRLVHMYCVESDIPLTLFCCPILVKVILGSLEEDRRENRSCTLSLFHTHTYTLTHARTRTHTHSLSLTHSLTQATHTERQCVLGTRFGVCGAIELQGV